MSRMTMQELQRARHKRCTVACTGRHAQQERSRRMQTSSFKKGSAPGSMQTRGEGEEMRAKGEEERVNFNTCSPYDLIAQHYWSILHRMLEGFH